MRTVGTVLWFLLAGWLAILYAAAGVIASVLVITIPLGTRVVDADREEMSGYRVAAAA